MAVWTKLENISSEAAFDGRRPFKLALFIISGSPSLVVGRCVNLYALLCQEASSSNNQPIV
jgi:hypothetical protein